MIIRFAHPRVRWFGQRNIVGMCLGVLLMLGTLQAAELDDARGNFRTGKYEQVISAAEDALAAGTAAENWHLLRIESLMALGRYPEADRALSEALTKEASSIRLRMLGRDVLRSNGRAEEGLEMVKAVRVLVSSQPWTYRDPVNLVTFGRAALVLGADAKDVLDRIYALAERSTPLPRELYLAKGELALAKHDYPLAASTYGEGVKQFPDDADLHYGLARAYENGDRGAMLISLEVALRCNPRHVPSLLLSAEHRIAAEDYREAETHLSDARDVNPASPEAWAFQAAIAHLKSQLEGERISRQEALRHWPTNPRVDYLIGRTLSQKYRFAEGAAYQRQALGFDAEFLPAKSQLASDLLRMGQDLEGWSLIQQVHARDGYDVEAFNLVTLSDTLSKYTTLSNEDFIVRMTSHEAAVYGPRVMALLMRAKEQLVDKYGAELERPTIVEIFADQRDFAVRTFGVPDVPGYLGVCFGRVVTANSPATTGSQSVNWEAVLWHEFCHVVTLQLTKNKMPRWLSEGISVYEERLASPVWGEQMNPRYRDMILAGQLTPVSRLSSAFLAPRSPLHLQFAYFQSSLVVEFIVERFGLDALKAILIDLREGEDINRTIASRTTQMANVEREFSLYAKARAEALGAGLDWEKPSAESVADPVAFSRWAKSNPGNYWAIMWEARERAARKEWEGVKTLLRPVIEKYPFQPGNDSAYRLLAEAHRSLGDTAGERAVLSDFAEVDGGAVDVYLRLMELAEAEADWPEVARNAQRFLAVNPLVAPPYRRLGQASAEIGDLTIAIDAYRVLLELNPTDPADVHFHLARWLHQHGDAGEARRHTLRALEEAPRFREALQLLQTLVRQSAVRASAAVPEPASSVLTLPQPPPLSL